MPTKTGMPDYALISRYATHQQARGLSPRTIDRRAWSLGQWVEHLHHDHATIPTATPMELDEFLVRWPSPQSRYSIRSDVHQLYRWANVAGLLDCDDPTDKSAAPKVPRRAASPIPADDVRRLVAAARGVDRLIVMLGAYAGLRVSEIAALRAEDVDIPHRLIVVRGGKGGRDDVVPMADELALELARWPRRGRLMLLAGPTVGKRIRALYRRHGVVGRPHDLRHSFGTQAAQRTNGNLVLVAKLMRHAEIATSQRYVAWHTTGHEIVSGLYSKEAA